MELNKPILVGYIKTQYFRLIETFAQWEGRINTTYLQTIVGVSRQKASEIINEYQQQLPNNLVYNPSLKGYVPTAAFTPYFTEGHIDEYSQLLARSGCQEYLSVFETGFCHLEAPLRNISAALVQPIIRAIRDNLRLDIGYTSLSSPDYEGRIIAPHCLVFDGIRWHVRAYCEKNADYRDFVLSRFNGEYAFEGPSEHPAAADERWQTWVDLVIQPDPRLTPEKRRLIELDYQMVNGQRTLRIRAALVMYLVQRLRLDQYQTTPEAQQIIIEPDSWKQITHYLP